MRKRRVRKISKAVLFSRLKKAADKLWSLYIRGRDKRCMLCGATEKLQAHHCIRRKALGNATRWHKNNGITLCYRCHMIEVHHNADKVVLAKYLKLLDEVYTKEQQDEVMSLYHAGIEITYADLQKIVDDLKEAIAKFKSKGE